MAVKLAQDMTEQEAKEYCMKYAAMGKWEADLVRLELAEGSTYRQIAFQLQNS